MSAPTQARRRWKRWAIEALLLVTALYALQLWLGRAMVSGQAPTLIADDLYGQPVDLAQRAGQPEQNIGHALAQEAGQPTLVYVWATWCPVCALMESTVNALAQDHRVISVAMQSGTASEVQQHLSAHKLDFLTVNDPEGQIARQWGVAAVPASFIVLPNGEIHARTRGYSTSLGLRARLWWAGLSD